jgi:hypothetical protein
MPINSPGKDDKKKPADPKDAPLGSGIANKGRDTVAASMAFKDYQMTKMSNGEKPVSFEDWKAGKR